MRITSTPINANSKPRHSIPDFLTTDHADKYRILRPPPPCSSVIIWYGSVAAVVEIFVSQTSVAQWTEAVVAISNAQSFGVGIVFIDTAVVAVAVNVIPFD